MGYLKRAAKEHDFKTVQEFFNYIITSYINGQKAQAKRIYEEYFAGEYAVEDYIYEACTMFEDGITILYKVGVPQIKIENGFWNAGDYDGFERCKEILRPLIHEDEDDTNY